MMRAVLCVAFLALCSANVYDHLMRTYLPPPLHRCKYGCADWTNVSTNKTEQERIDSFWLHGKPPSDAGSHCAMPGHSAGSHEQDSRRDPREKLTDSFAGPWCYCRNETHRRPENLTQYCQNPLEIPEQINLQLAKPDVVVVSFVTFDLQKPTTAPIAMFGKNASNLTAVSGVSHWYVEPEGLRRNYTLHFVKLANLEERETYYYQVKSGSPTGQWSDVYSFRAVYTSGVTRIGMYGDMGHSLYNNMDNLLKDCENGYIDAIAHMGDHAYNMGMADDRRGDAYMNVFQPVLARCPWVPVIGNHEFFDGDKYEHYLNITWGEAYGQEDNFTTTATSALGHLLAKSTMFGPGFHGTPPSGTSRYFSVDIGLIHILALDLNNLDADQLEWAKADLESANTNRKAVPWIIVTNPNASASYYKGEASEKFATSGHEFHPIDPASDEQTLAQFQAFLAASLEPLLIEYDVEIYNAGHIHDYAVSYPMKDNKICQDHYKDPTCTVYIVEGNGGVPGVHSGHAVKGGAYGRIIALNETHLEYEHVANNGGEITDKFEIIKHKHGSVSF